MTKATFKMKFNWTYSFKGLGSVMAEERYESRQLAQKLRAHILIFKQEAENTLGISYESFESILPNFS